MAKNKLCRIVYRKKDSQEFYDLEISLDGGETWGLNVSCEFINSEKYPSQGANYLHYSIVVELARCFEYGFRFIGIC